MRNAELWKELARLITQQYGIRMDGQRVDIRIITDEYLKLPRSFAYEYEVVSQGSPYFRAVDFAHSDRETILSAGHTYSVRFGDDPDNPRIVEVYGELPME